MTSPAIFCAIQPDGVTWDHLLTVEQVEDPDRAPAVVVVPCPEHDTLSRPELTGG